MYTITIEPTTTGTYVIVNHDLQKTVFEGSITECFDEMREYYRGYNPQFEE